ncbi:uncharacterized protein LOC112535855 [Ricinus communis]|uniref:uncharacterized protein LOC112535855 n=1 Tax=Ricinus communis TaxID=3988 RepID=UPI00201AFA33|nr:uncharacterized protein LOC112535855 [Ricinus communis]
MWEVERLHHLLSQLKEVPNLEILSCIVYTNQAKQLPVASISAFRNLKQLKIFYFDDKNSKDLAWFPPVMLPKAQKKMKTLCGCTHENLKQVERGGCTDNWHEIELMLFLLKNAIALERMIIHSSIKIDSIYGKWISFKSKFSNRMEPGLDILQKSL